MPQNDKFRITFENVNAVLNYFRPDRDPEGVVCKSLLIVPGAHAKLDNIDVESYTWKETQVFSICGEEVVYTAGASAAPHLKAYVEVKRLHPELFEKIRVYAQPAATMDEVTQVWHIEDLMKEFPQAVHQRDLFSAALTDKSKIAMKLAHHLPHWIAGGMTPVLQLTDTDIR